MGVWEERGRSKGWYFGFWYGYWVVFGVVFLDGEYGGRSRFCGEGDNGFFLDWGFRDGVF